MGKKEGAKADSNIKKIYDRLKESPATPKQLRKELKIQKRTVTNNLRTLKELNLIEKIDNDKYIYIGPSDTKPESEIEELYSKLKRKFMRDPTHEEIAANIKKPINETRELLSKKVAAYSEPADEAVTSASIRVQNMIIRGAWDELDPPKSKKEWFEQGIDKVVIEGIDQESFNELLENNPQFSLDEARIYLEEFPEMKANITSLESGNHFLYKIEWSDDARKVLHQLLPWDHKAEIRLPIKYPEEIEKPLGYDAYRAFEVAEKMADVYVPSQEMIDDLLGLVGLSHFESEVLLILKKFCQNALEVDRLNDETKYKIASKLLEIAFSTENIIKNRDYEHPGKDNVEEKRNAFDIIEMLNFRDPLVINAAKNYIYYVIDLGSNIDFIGTDPYKVVRWLAQDPDTRIEIIEDIKKEILPRARDDVTVSQCICLLKSL